MVTRLGSAAQSLLRRRVWFSAFVQAAVVLAALQLAWFLRFEFDVTNGHVLARAALLLIVIRLICIRGFNLLHGWWSYAGVNEVLDIIKASVLGSVIFYIVLRFVIGDTGFPTSVYFAEFVITSTSLCVLRMISKVLVETMHKANAQHRAIVIGAGFAGQMIVRELKRSGEIEVVGIVDDDSTKHGIKLLGIPVLGFVDDLPRYVNEQSVDEVLIAVPSASKKQMRRFVEISERAGARFRTVPALHDIISGAAKTEQLRDVSMEDLLGREPVAMNVSAVKGQITGRDILVTGAAGSIGSELCRQIIQYSPSELICVDHNENGMFFLEQELRKINKGSALRFVVADIGSADRMQQVFAEHNVETIFHAAAYKHVPVMERNVPAAVRNNVFALLTLLRTAESAGCKNLVMISSDKAVNPTNVMGCTKRVCEIILASRPSPMRCLSVRFGNVLGSNGSVVPIFREQLRKGEAITVTHPEITRYFMTINEAVSLVLQAATIGESRDTLVLDMGDPIPVIDIARTMIRLCGKSVDKVPIRFSGLREGEKLFEELFYSYERVVASPCPKVHRTAGQIQNWQTVQLLIDELRLRMTYADANELRQTLKKIVPEYTYKMAKRPETIRATAASTGALS